MKESPHHGLLPSALHIALPKGLRAACCKENGKQKVGQNEVFFWFLFEGFFFFFGVRYSVCLFKTCLFSFNTRISKDKLVN